MSVTAADMRPARSNGLHPGGAPTKYKPEFHPQLAFRMSLLGADLDRVADAFEIPSGTLDEWISRYPELSDSLRRGRDRADAEMAASLYHRGKGLTITEETAVKHRDGTVEIVKLRRQLPPDPVSMIFWLKNRQREQWRDVSDHKHTLQIQTMSPEQRQVEIQRLEAQLADIPDAEIIEPASPDNDGQSLDTAQNLTTMDDK